MSPDQNRPGPSEGHPEQPAGFKVWRPGQVAYRDALAFQETLLEQRAGGSCDFLILLEHPPVVTMGRRSAAENLLSSPAELLGAGVEYVETRRGGDVTLHNPGQLVGYPIVDLNHYQRDIHRFLRLLEDVLIATLTDFGLPGETVPGKTGVWVYGRKIASIGVAVRRWISYHGFALNIGNDLAMFDKIIPCGLPGVTMTSMSKELGRTLALDEVSDVLIGHFSTIMQRPFIGSKDDDETTPQA